MQDPVPAPYTERPAHSGDLEAMFDCFRTTMQSHIADAFGWNDDFQRGAFMARALDADCSVLEVEAGLSGFSWVDVGDEWSLRRLCIQPQYQGRGIGSHWVSELIHKAECSGKSIVLKVLRTNQRAAQLYERLGFVSINEDAQGIKMRRDTSKSIASRSAVP